MWLAGPSGCGLWALERRLSSCGARASLLRGMWDLPRPGLEPVSPALAGGFLTTMPPGKPSPHHFLNGILSPFHLLTSHLFNKLIKHTYSKHWLLTKIPLRWVLLDSRGQVTSPESDNQPEFEHRSLLTINSELFPINCTADL